MLYENMDKSKIEAVMDKVENNSNTLDDIIEGLTREYTKDLDEYVAFVRSILEDEDNPPTSQELDNFCMNLATYIYYASSMQEQLGIKDDIARALYKEMYHSKRDSIEKGTIADKDSMAELATQAEYLTSVMYKRAYAIVKAKVTSAQELLASLKKVISRRITEMELTKMTGGQ